MVILAREFNNFAFFFIFIQAYRAGISFNYLGEGYWGLRVRIDEFWEIVWIVRICAVAVHEVVGVSVHRVEVPQHKYQRVDEQIREIVLKLPYEHRHQHSKETVNEANCCNHHIHMIAPLREYPPQLVSKRILAF